MKDSDYVKINSVNPLYLIISEANGYMEEKNGSKYLVFDSANKNNEVLKKYNKIWDGIKNKTGTINAGKTSKHSSVEYGKNFMKIKFDTNDNLPLNKKLKLYNTTIVIKFVFEEDGKVCLDECLYELRT